MVVQNIGDQSFGLNLYTSVTSTLKDFVKFSFGVLFFKGDYELKESIKI